MQASNKCAEMAKAVRGAELRAAESEAQACRPAHNATATLSPVGAARSHQNCHGRKRPQNIAPRPRYPNESMRAAHSHTGRPAESVAWCASAADERQRSSEGAHGAFRAAVGAADVRFHAGHCACRRSSCSCSCAQKPTGSANGSMRCSSRPPPRARPHPHPPVARARTRAARTRPQKVHRHPRTHTPDACAAERLFAHRRQPLVVRCRVVPRQLSQASLKSQDKAQTAEASLRSLQATAAAHLPPV